MTPKFPKVLIFSSAVFLFSCIVRGQVLTVTDTSDAHAMRIKSTINSNREIVDFVEHSLVKRGLPKHLRNLPLLESGFDRTRISSTGAAGIWQLMPAHANFYGLSESDRSDIYKSTQVALNSLSSLYKKYRNWITVLAAYSCGEANVAKAMEKAGSKNYADYYLYLPDETTNAIRKYINACYVTGELNDLLPNYSMDTLKPKKPAGGNPELQSVSEEQPVDPSLLKTQINSAYDLGIVANFLGTTVENIENWNPNLKQNINEKSDVDFYLPSELMGKFEANRNKILRLSLMK
ncbi:lytic transglycosylase domain-containing protein [Elizabethkingia meningoseptica]|uniref:Lytic murein transglycosylase n=1 Tax=Elizabethkingia meningoseptica TaxID=238 RepID=A0A1V3U357_ELIME|nr:MULTISPECIES: lytic transglycosylase domain-containing protein [Elizabethkingia]AQX06275.1 lytic murein transglycosylase [Elizabethkingia meningoseptica]AQX13805.1 lytic murein transglycosylase [Elizabethkingia meningoseptica]AQX48324.1 lytic murein transglycosylase [Elizabethkingia meningoseptica]EJK5327289.1 lytic transglycosylase domain-containing protein [Elizabethkingia meningoseptica]EOR29338.1 Soluble lytic murein transglycosylase [Elizabethkingia meningoseptica ATCC 13253 = NBRC 125